MVGRIASIFFSFCLVSVFTVFPSFANIPQHPHSIGLANESYVILLVGLKQHELAANERYLLNSRKIIQLQNQLNWTDAIEKTQAKEIIVKHNSGFAGLYAPDGSLIRPIELADGSNPIQQETRTGLVSDYPYDELRSQTGYQTGGQIDPYRPQRYADNYANNARLSPGWGYNSDYDKPRSARSATVDFLNYMPLDVTTPVNYYGQFGGSPSISAGYALGILPHVIGFATRLKRGQAEKKDYDFYKREQGIPDYLDAAPDYYYAGARNEETNPITTDPNFIRYDNAPQAFRQNYPTYGYNTQPVPEF